MSDSITDATPGNEPVEGDTSNSEAAEQGQEQEQMGLFNAEVNGAFENMYPENTEKKEEEEEKKEGKEEQQEANEEEPKSGENATIELEEGDPATTSDTDALAKRIGDKDVMIARQSNEIGELRKEVKEMLAIMQEKKAPTEVPAQEDVLLNATEDEIAAALVKDSGDVLAQEDALYQAKLIKGSLQAAEKLVSKRIAPLLEQHENNVLRNNFNAEESAWMKSHGEYGARKDIVKSLVDAAYPEGIAKSMNPYKESEKFFGVLNVAYAAAGKILDSAKGKVASGERSRVISQRNVNTSAATSSRPVVPKQKKLSAFDAEIENAVTRAFST